MAVFDGDDVIIISQTGIIVDWVFIEEEFLGIDDGNIWLLLIDHADGRWERIILEDQDILDEMEFLAAPDL